MNQRKEGRRKKKKKKKKTKKKGEEEEEEEEEKNKKGEETRNKLEVKGGTDGKWEMKDDLRYREVELANAIMKVERGK